MAPSYIAAAVLFLMQVLPFFGISVEQSALTTTIATLIAIVAPLVIMIRQVIIGRSTVLGARP